MVIGVLERVLRDVVGRGGVNEAGRGVVQELIISCSRFRSNIHEAQRSVVQNVSSSGFQEANISLVQDAGRNGVQEANRNVVQGVGRSGVEQGDNRSDAVQVKKKDSFSPAWVEDASLPPGWRTCKPAPKKVMYYSPCGSLFTNRTKVEKFIAVRTTYTGAGVVSKKPCQVAVVKKVEPNGRGRYMGEGISRKVPTVVKRRELSETGYVRQIPKDLKKVKIQDRKKLNTWEQLNSGNPGLGCDSNLTSSEGVISLRDDNFHCKEYSRGKRKIYQHEEEPSPRKLCFGKMTVADLSETKLLKLEAEIKVLENNIKTLLWDIKTLMLDARIKDAERRLKDLKDELKEVKDYKKTLEEKLKNLEGELTESKFKEKEDVDYWKREARNSFDEMMAWREEAKMMRKEATYWRELSKIGSQKHLKTLKIWKK